MCRPFGALRYHSSRTRGSRPGLSCTAPPGLNPFAGRLPSVTDRLSAEEPSFVSTDPRDTPMMRQYREAKAQHPGMLLLFRMGGFYETLDDDADLASRVLGLTLTSRDRQVPMAGFPHHQLENYLRKLLHAGHRVAVCDQVEDPALAKGLVKREVTRVVTAGTVTEDELLDPRRANHIAAVAR